MSTEITHRTVDVGQVRLQVAEAGEGPLVLLLHGFPESWYSWRHQIASLAEAGYRVVAPNQRGFPGSDAPPAVEEYSMLHLVGDVVGLARALGEERFVVAGHDWGAPVAWHTALLRPDLVRGVIGLSVPPRPRTPFPPIAAMRKRGGEGYYMVYFQTPEVPEKELERDLPATFRRLLCAADGEGPSLAPIVPPGGGFLDVCPEPDRLPGWLTAEDVDHFAAEYAESGFRGPINWYRNLDRSWALTAPWHGTPIQVPALFVGGDRDPVAGTPGGGPPSEDDLRRMLPQLRSAVVLPGIGHWTQQEAPQEVTTAMLDFLRGLDG